MNDSKQPFASSAPMNGAMTPASQMPMFYKAPRPLDKTKDQNLRLSRPDNFNFAANTNAIPIFADEFPMAAAWFPIVFAAGDQPVPAAVVGLRPDANLFVDEDGQWRNNAYMPIYMRRYPFILMEDPEQKQFVLCIDEQCPMLDSEGEFALFENGEPSEFTKGAMEFCGGLHTQGQATEEFLNALKEHDLLRPNDSEVDLPGNTRLQLSGFQVIDPQKFDALPDSVWLRWRRKGWIGLIYAHLLSSHRWTNLVSLLQTVEGEGDSDEEEENA